MKRKNRKGLKRRMALFLALELAAASSLGGLTVLAQETDVDESETEVRVLDAEDEEDEVVDEGTCGDDLTWTLTESGVLTISGSGDMTSWKSYGANDWNDNSSIISVVIEDGVTSIGNFAFERCTGLTSVYIPDTVTSIGQYAFAYCENLAAIEGTLDSVETLGTRAFYECSCLETAISLDSITAINGSAFYGCTSLTKVTLGDSLEKIGSAAFSGCSSLSSINIPDSVEEIGINVFAGCTSLADESGCVVLSGVMYAYVGYSVNVSIPETTAEIYDYTCYQNASIESVSIPASVETIGSYAFGDCTALTEVTFAEGSDADFGYNVFSGCTGLTDDNGFTIAGGYLSSYSGSSTDVVIPEGVTRILPRAFIENSDITSVTIPEGVTRIDDESFYWCEELESVSLPATLTRIGDDAFGLCYALKEVTYAGTDVIQTGEDVFEDCDALADENECIIINGVLYDYLNGSGYYPSLPEEGITWIASYALANLYYYGIEIPETIMGISAYAFYGCLNCHSVTIPASVTQIDTDAFYGCDFYNGITFEGTAPTILNGSYFTNDDDFIIYYYSTNEGWTEEYLTNLIQNSNVTLIDLAYQDISGGVIILESYAYTYTGSEILPEIYTVYLEDGTELSADDYEVSCTNNVDVGTAEVTVTGIGNYTGSITVTFEIEAQEIISSDVTLEYTSKTYTGSTFSPSVTVVDASGNELTEGENADYTLTTPSGRKNAGTYKYTITGTGNYTGTVTETLTIKPVSIKTSSSAYVSCTLSATSYTYSGSAKKPSVTLKVKVNGKTKTLSKSSSSGYTVSYKNNTKIGKATVTITGTGNYTGTITKTFKILPKKGTISSLKSSAKKKMTVKWKTISGSVTKYQVRYRVKGTSSWTTKTYSSSTKSKTITGLKSGKTYQVQVRAYRTVSGTKYYGSWSSTKTVKVK